MNEPAELTVAVVTEEDLDDLAPSLLAYARFYREDPSVLELTSMARAFIATGSATQVIARDGDGTPAGHATVLWSWDTTLGLPLAVMEDLYVHADHRSQGAGRALLEACRSLAADRGCRWLQWQTAPDNERAQRLYDSLGGDRSEWLTYRLPTGVPSA